MLWYLLFAFILGYASANRRLPETQVKTDYPSSSPQSKDNKPFHPVSGVMGQTTPASQRSSLVQATATMKNDALNNEPKSPPSPGMTVRGRPMKDSWEQGGGHLTNWDDDAPEIASISREQESDPNVGVHPSPEQRNHVEPYRPPINQVHRLRQSPNAMVSTTTSGVSMLKGTKSKICRIMEDGAGMTGEKFITGVTGL